MDAVALQTMLVSAACLLPFVVACVLGWGLWISAPGRRSAGVVSSIVLLISFATLVFAAWLSLSGGDRAPRAAISVATFGDKTFGLGLAIDSLSLLMAVTVTFVASCVSIYATGYLATDAEELVDDTEVGSRPGRYSWFFCCLLGFAGCMLALVFSDNLFQTFVFWELVGACSYFLIGFYRERPAAGPAASKAFVMNRVGDLGFFVGIMIFWTQLGTLSFEQIRDVVADIPVSGGGSPAWLVTASLCVFAGCIGKSAQFPLQTWLPDAMAGPTPVSALVHSATMVAAGVYLVARMTPVFPAEALLVIAYCGMLTAFIGAAFALAADDIKKILAYSSISQLGYMMLALGLGGWTAGVLHLLTHACFKSLLFLVAGSVIHQCHHEQSLRQLGGLRSRMPITAFLGAIGVTAICGLAFGGFYSKDAILAHAMAFAKLNPMHVVLFILPVITAGMTALYMGRFYFGIFWGRPRSVAAEHGKESPAVMCVAMSLIAFATVFATAGGEQGWLMPAVQAASEDFHSAIAPEHLAAVYSEPTFVDQYAVHAAAGFLAYLVAIGGLVAAWFVVVKRPLTETGWLDWTPRLGRFVRAGGYFDDVYSASVVDPAIKTGRGLAQYDKNGLDACLHGVARMAVRVARAEESFDRTFIDGLVNLVGRLTDSSGTTMARIQTGSLRHYVLMLVAGLLSAFAVLFTFLPA